jgi:hypothetical protein
MLSFMFGSNNVLVLPIYYLRLNDLDLSSLSREILTHIVARLLEFPYDRNSGFPRSIAVDRDAQLRNPIF